MPHEEPVRTRRYLRHLKSSRVISDGKVRMLEHVNKRLHKRMGIATDIKDAGSPQLSDNGINSGRLSHINEGPA